MSLISWFSSWEGKKLCFCLSFFAVGNETAHSCFCPCFLFFVAILAIRWFLIDGFLFLKSYYYLNFSSWGLLLIFEIFISMTFVLKEMMFMEWKRFAVGTLKRKRQKIMFVFRFLLSEMKLLILASVLAFYSLSRYSPLKV